jgi:hypothetical protein
LRRLAGVDEIGKVVGRSAVDARRSARGDTGDGTGEAVLNAELEATGVEGVEVGEEGCVTLEKRKKRRERD